MAFPPVANVLDESYRLLTSGVNRQSLADKESPRFIYVMNDD